MYISPHMKKDVLINISINFWVRYGLWYLFKQELYVFRRIEHK